MIPKTFEYYAAGSVDEAVELLQKHGDEARVLAGGHSLIPAMKLRLADPPVLVDISGIEDLSYIEANGDHIAIGAGTTHHDIASSPVLAEGWTALSEAASGIGDVQVRNRGTIGGALVHADPAADLPPVMLALDARMVARGPDGERVIDGADFYLAIFTTTLNPGEILTEVRIPRGSGAAGSAYLKLARKASDFAVVGAAAWLQLDEDGACSAARVAMTGVSDVPYRAEGVEEMLAGKTLDDETLREACARAAEGVEVVGDVHASADYRRAVAGVYARRALEKALERAMAAAS